MPIPTIPHLTIEGISQTLLCVLSGISIFYMSGKQHKKAFIFSLLGQPFWFYSTFTAGQWGMFILSLWHCGNQIRGLLNHKEEVL